MSGKSAADDFFGIEYMSTQPGISEHKEMQEKENPSQQTNAEKAFVEGRFEEENQLSGTDFLDRAFFGDFRHERITADQDPKHSFDFFEENFFKKLASESKTAAPFSQKAHQQIMEEGMSEGHPQAEGQRVSVKIPCDRQHHAVTFNEKERNTGGFSLSENLDGIEDKSVTQVRSQDLSGLNKIRSTIIPIWRMNQEELVDFMTTRIVYNKDNIIAFDKPYGMAYSSASENTPQLDRLLQKIKCLFRFYARVAPKCERLYLVKSLDKYQSGIIVFATDTSMQSKLKESIDSGLMVQISRCIVRGELSDSPLKVTIPLIKTMKKRNMKMVPLLTNKSGKEIFYVDSECRTIKGNQYASLVEVVTRKEAPHQIRAHLALAGCPLIGDAKYSNSSPRPPRLSYRLLEMLGVSDSQTRKIPMYLHLNQIDFSGISKSNNPIRMSAPLPEHFSWMLKKLKLLKLKH